MPQCCIFCCVILFDPLKKYVVFGVSPSYQCYKYD
jgi:hypothetical protein